jgi:protein tyrosine phosphatase (PTP) superfamily phosphohydrolase (DUF442 family)
VAVWTVKTYRHHFLTKRFYVVEAGAIYRGGWQQPWPLRRLTRQHGFRTILNLACRPDEPDADGEGAVVREFGLHWHRLLMPGTGRGSFQQLDAAADVLADPALRPVFVHCDGGRHRTNMALAAYRIKHCAWSMDQVVGELQRYGFDPAEHGRQLRHLHDYVAHVQKVRSRATAAAR